MPKKPPPSQPLILQKSQPRSLSQESGLQPEETYKAGWYAERQKFGSRPAQEILEQAYQKKLFDTSLPEEEAIQSFGLALTIPEDKALSAIQKVLSRLDYKGNGMPENTTFGRLPRISFTISWEEYYEAYGLEKINGKYQGKACQEARDALLDGLTQPRTIGIKRKRYEGKGKDRKEVWDVIATKSPLIQVTKYYQGLSREEVSEVESGEVLRHRVTKLGIEVSGLLLFDIENFVLKPANLHKEIEEHLKAKGVARRSQAISLFIQYLLTLDISEPQISIERLAEVLRLDYYLKNRKRKQLEKRLKECFEVATELGYLLEFSEHVSGNFLLKLNRERCTRLDWKLRKKEEAIEKKALADKEAAAKCER